MYLSVFRRPLGLTFSQHPFAAGITLAGFSAFSVDENWIPAFIESTAGSIHKVGRISTPYSNRIEHQHTTASQVAVISSILRHRCREYGRSTLRRRCEKVYCNGMLFLFLELLR